MSIVNEEYCPTSIVIDPDIVNGLPHIESTDVVAFDVYIWHKLSGVKIEIISEKASISEAQIYAALA